MRPLALLSVLLFLGVSPVGGQEGASLAEVESLAAQGRILEARETLESWWTARFSTASRMDRQRGIWMRGKLTVDPSMAELDFRRLVLEFPGGPYSDDALFRLGLSAELRRDLREAQRSFETLLRDYPSSPRVAEARLWIRAHEEEIAGLPAMAPPPDPESEEGIEGGAGSGTGEFSVQLGAFRSLERARSLAGQLQKEGYAPRMVRTPGNDLARVRVGRYTDRDEAEAMARELEGLGFEVTLVTDAGSEERIGRSPLPESGGQGLGESPVPEP